MKQLQRYIYIVLFYAVCIIPITTQAQLWAPIGTRWTYSYSEDMASASIPKTLVVTDTVTRLGKLCTIIHLDGVAYDTASDMFFTMFTYSDSGKVFLFNPYKNTFVTLYDFNKKVGEYWDIVDLPTWGATKDEFCSLRMYVRSTGIDTINGFPLRTMEMELEFGMPGQRAFHGKVIESIGCLTRPRPDPTHLCRNISENFDFVQLRCFENSEIGFHDFKIVPTCDYVYTGINENIRQSLFSLKPNPFTNLIELNILNPQIKSSSIRIIDVFGRMVYENSFKENANIITTDWHSGLYFYTIYNNGAIIANGKLEKH